MYLNLRNNDDVSSYMQFTCSSSRTVFLLIINFTKPLKKETLLFKGKLTNVCGLGGPLKAHSKQSLFFFLANKLEDILLYYRNKLMKI